MSPLDALATSMAYVILGDDKIAMEEKAKLFGLLGKHVTRNEVSEASLKSIVSQAFKYAKETNFRDFLETVADKLSKGQRVCIMINLYDMSLSDGGVTIGEAEILNRFRHAFGIQKDNMTAVREVLQVKNETGMFINRNHPYNSPDFIFDIRSNSE